MRRTTDRMHVTCRTLLTNTLEIRPKLASRVLDFLTPTLFNAHQPSICPFIRRERCRRRSASTVSTPASPFKSLEGLRWLAESSELSPSELPRRRDASDANAWLPLLEPLLPSQLKDPKSDELPPAHLKPLQLARLLRILLVARREGVLTCSVTLGSSLDAGEL